MHILTLPDILRDKMTSDNKLILVTGSYDSGKSGFIRSVSEHTWDEIGQNGFIDYYVDGKFSNQEQVGSGQIRISDAANLFLLELPGARRWDTVLELLDFNDMLAGIIVLMNSALPETFREASSIVKVCQAYETVPHVIAANFQDHKDAWLLDDLRRAIRLPFDEAILPCSISNPAGAKQVLINLLDKIEWEHSEQAKQVIQNLQKPHKEIYFPEYCPPAADADKVEKSIANLKHPERLTRSTAIWSLARSKDERALKPIAAILKNPDEVWEIRCSAAFFLGHFDDAGINILLSALKDSDVWARYAAMDALGQISDERTFETLLMYLTDSDPVMRWLALHATGNFGDERAAPLLLNYFDDDIIAIRIAAIVASGKLNTPESLASLITALDDTEAIVRYHAVEALCSFDDPRVKLALQKMLQDDNRIVREEAERKLNPG